MQRQLPSLATIYFGCLVFGLDIPHAQPVGIFHDSLISQHAFAAKEIRAALEAKGLQAEMRTLGEFSPTYPNRKIVIALAANSTITAALAAAGGDPVVGLGEQAYAIRTTTTGNFSHWVIGGDVNGAMYGGLQVSENISHRGFGPTVNTQESPHILYRGIKFNAPLDVRSPVYYSSGFSANDFRGTAAKKAIPHVWDVNFWSEWFDEMARHRYNVLSLWTLHPFTSMIKMPEYPNVALQNVQGFDGFTKNLSIDQKIAYWRQVMTLARNRGFEFYIFNWNIYTYGATGKYGIDNSPNNSATVEYFRKSMTQLLDTYPDLTGFGVTAGENMGDINEAANAKWMWSTYGRGVADFANANKNRKVVFIHRYHGAGASSVMANFGDLIALPNVRFDFSYKYAIAHMYSTPSPAWITTIDGNVPAQLDQFKAKTWLELRNDDFYMLHWGNPDFARKYIAAFPDKDRYIRGFFMGSDGFTFTRTFAGKSQWSKDMLEIKRHWYTQMIWGRLAYNPALSDDVFRNHMAAKYPGISSGTLFSAWSKASEAVPLMTELVQGTWKSDFLWWPEASLSRREGFITITQMAETEPTPGSDKCSIAKTASGGCGNKISAVKVAEQMESAAMGALNLVGTQGASTQNEMQTNLANIRALSYLGLYYAEKIRGAVFKSSGKNAEAREVMGQAYCYWSTYSSLMNEMYTGMEMQRTSAFANWLAFDSKALAEYTALGGKGNPVCKTITVSLEREGKLKPPPSFLSLSPEGLSLNLPSQGTLSLSIYSLRGERVSHIVAYTGIAGKQSIPLSGNLANGVYWVRINFDGATLTRKMSTVGR